MKGLIRFIQAILIIVWVGLLALAVMLHLSVDEDGMPGISDWRGFVVTDSSMAPELSPGDLAVISLEEAAQPGDVILYRDSSEKLALTRIIGTSEGQLILKGDGQAESFLAPADTALGVSAGYAPGFGEPLMFLCSLTGILTIFAAGLVLVVLPGFLLLSPSKPKAKKAPRPGPPRQGGYTPRH